MRSRAGDRRHPCRVGFKTDVTIPIRNHATCLDVQCAIAYSPTCRTPPLFHCEPVPVTVASPVEPDAKPMKPKVLETMPPDSTFSVPLSPMPVLQAGVENQAHAGNKLDKWIDTITPAAPAHRRYWA